MNWNLVPVTFWNSTPPMCDGLPMPAVPNVALSGLAFSQAIISRRLFTGKSFFTANSHGVLPISAIGSKSATTS